MMNNNDDIKSDKILIVEDEGIIAQDMKNILKRYGYGKVDIVNSGEDLLKKIVKFQPNLVLMDIMIKGCFDGVEAAGIVNDCFDIPVVYVTAYATDDILDRAKTTKPYGYVVKPFKDEELNAAVEMALHKHREEKI